MAKQTAENLTKNPAAELSEEEKNTLRHRLEDSRYQTHEKNTPEQEGHSKSPEQVSILKVIWNFFLSLIMSVPFKENASISMRRVREIRQHLSRLGVNFYHFKSGALNSEFALYMLEIYRSSFPVYLFFQNPKNESCYDEYVNAFFESLLEEKPKELLSQLSRVNIEKMFYDESIPDKREALKQKQKAFSDHLKGNTLKAIQAALLPLEQLSVFYQEFDFQNFFALFGNFENHQLAVNFSQIDSEKALPFLRSLGALCKMVTEQELNPYTQKALEIANARMQEKGYKEPRYRLSAEQMNKGLMMIRKLIKLDILDNLIQYITLNEKEISGFVRFKKTLLSRYQSLLTLNSTRVFNELEDQKAKEFLVRHIREFFNIRTESDLDFHPIYNMELQRHLETVEIKTMEWVKPLSILHAFLEKYFEELIREVVNTVVVKGTFVKKQDGEDFSANYYQLDDVIEKLRALMEEEMTPSERVKNPVLEMISAKKELTPVERKTVKEKLGKYDQQIHFHMEKIVDHLFDLSQKLREFQGDLKKRHPELLSNIKSLQGTRNMSFPSALDKAVETLDQFFNIIRNFIVIKSQLSSDLKKMEKMGL